MIKNSSYFSHDSNARNDEKIIAVRMKYGIEGYGIYFAIIERLRESTDYVGVKDYNVIAFDLRVDASKIKSIIEDFGLFAFTEDGKCFYSESLIERMKPLENLREQRRQAGLKSAEKREKNKENSTTVEQSLDGCLTKIQLSKVKESKVKEIKEEEKKIIKKEIAPNVATKKNKPIEDRKTDFYNSLVDYVKKYSAPMIRDFFEYWTETDTKKEKMRFEDQKYFDVICNNKNKFNNNTSSNKSNYTYII